MAELAKGGNRRQSLADVYAAHRASHPDHPFHPITVQGRVDGAGAQALGIVSALLWARATRCRYLHTPFATIDHAIGSRKAWAVKWEAFLNLGLGETPVPDNAQVVSVEDFLRDPAAYADPGIVLAATQFHWRRFQTRTALRHVRTSLRSRYFASNKAGMRLHRSSPKALVAAVHIRRGDVTADHPQRAIFYTQDEPILNTIQSIRSVARTIGRSVEVNVYSEGPPEMFDAFSAVGCRLHLDSNAFEAFHNLVRADILVQAKSSFSYVSGLISSGVVLHEPYFFGGRHPAYLPAPGWIVREAGGSFDTARFHRALTRPLYHRPLRRLWRWLSSR